MLGWRKLGAWFLVYALVAVATFLKVDITDNGVEIIKWVTGFFFGANTLKAFSGYVFTPGPKKVPIEEPKR